MVNYIHKLDDVLKFGQYKGSTIEEVLHNDPKYLLWLIDNIEWFDLDTEIYNNAHASVYEEDMNTFLLYGILK